jgi:two-component system, NarL family, invasion response regulator UvrY
MYKIIIADDHAIVRKGLKMILDDEPDMRITEEAENGDELLEKINKNRFDLIILDIGMPGRDAFDILTHIKNMPNIPPVLILSMNPEELFARRLLALGASGYLNKESNPEEIIKAIRKVLNGGMYITSTLAENLAVNIFKPGMQAPQETLTPREFQILCHIAKGESLSEISTSLFLSKATVSNHRTNLMKKLKLKNNSEITQYAIKNKFI